MSHQSATIRLALDNYQLYELLSYSICIIYMFMNHYGINEERSFVYTLRVYCVEVFRYKKCFVIMC